MAYEAGMSSLPTVVYGVYGILYALPLLGGIINGNKILATDFKWKTENSMAYYKRIYIEALFSVTSYVIGLTRMWANAQRNGRPAEYRWRPLFNDTKFG